MADTDARTFFHRRESTDGVEVVHVDYPHLDLECRDPLYDLVENGGVRKLVLDLARVIRVSSSALGVLVSLNRRLEAAGGRMALAGLDPNVAYMFAVTTLDRILTIRPDVAGAVEALRT